MTGWQTLFYKEILRFWKVGFQTVGAPVLTAVMYMLIFGHVMQGKELAGQERATGVAGFSAGRFTGERLQIDQLSARARAFVAQVKG